MCKVSSPFCLTFYFIQWTTTCPLQDSLLGSRALYNHDGAVAVMDAVVASATNKGAAQKMIRLDRHEFIWLPLKGTEISGPNNEEISLDRLDIVNNFVSDLATTNYHLGLDLALFPS